MEHRIANINIHYLYQTQGTPLTIETILSLMGQNIYTSVSQQLLNDKVDTSSLNLSPIITKYLNNLKQNNKIIRTSCFAVFSHLFYISIRVSVKRWD